MHTLHQMDTGLIAPYFLTPAAAAVFAESRVVLVESLVGFTDIGEDGLCLFRVGDQFTAQPHHLAKLLGIFVFLFHQFGVALAAGNE